jgi:hypothetical protein
MKEYTLDDVQRAMATSFAVGVSAGIILMLLTVVWATYGDLESLRKEIIDRGYAQWGSDVGGKKVLLWREKK